MQRMSYATIQWQQSGGIGRITRFVVPSRK